MKWIWPRIWADERGGWWRFVVTITLFAGSVVLGMVLFTAAMLGGLKHAIKNEPAHIQEVVQLIGTVLITGLGLAGLLIGVRFVHHKSIRCLFTDGRPFRLGFAVQSAALWALLWFAGAALLPNGWELLVRRAGELPLAWWPVLSVAIFCAMAVGRTAEEIVFRGYLQRHEWRRGSSALGWLPASRPSFSLWFTVGMWLHILLSPSSASHSVPPVFGLALWHRWSVCTQRRTRWSVSGIPKRRMRARPGWM